MPRSDHERLTRFGGRLRATDIVRRRAMPAAARWGVVVALGITLTLVSSVAHAEEVFTGQAAAANATDSTWIAAPAQPAAVCIVDSGNDANPDTTNVVARLSVDGGDGADLDSSSHHGTLMSMIASAPYNGFGMVGAAPSVKVVSVRATRPGNGASFSFSDLLSAVDICRSWRASYNIKVVSLSLGFRNTGPLDSVTDTRMRTSIDRARLAGLSVVAAAGNHPGAVDWPAAYAPVFAVGAADNEGARCDFAAAGPEVDLWAPGCPQDVALPDGTAAWASGSSEATAYVASALAQLRGLRPDLAPDAADALLGSTARAEGARRTLDVAAAFHTAGLDAELAQGHGAIPPLSAPADRAPIGPSTPAGTAEVGSSTTSTAGLTPDPGSPTQNAPGAFPRSVAAAPGSFARLSKPRVRSLGHRDGQLCVVFKNKPARILARVQVYTRTRRKAFPTLARRVRVTGDRLLTRVSGTVSQVSITYVDPTGSRRESARLTLRP